MSSSPARISLAATGYYSTPEIHYDRNSHRGRPFYYFAYGAALSEVVIDTLTGEHRVVAVDILHDVGRSLNPKLMDEVGIDDALTQGVASFPQTQKLYERLAREIKRQG